MISFSKIQKTGTYFQKLQEIRAKGTISTKATKRKDIQTTFIQDNIKKTLIAVPRKILISKVQLVK